MFVVLEEFVFGLVMWRASRRIVGNDGSDLRERELCRRSGSPWTWWGAQTSWWRWKINGKCSGLLVNLLNYLILKLNTLKPDQRIYIVAILTTKIWLFHEGEDWWFSVFLYLVLSICCWSVCVFMRLFSSVWIQSVLSCCLVFTFRMCRRITKNLNHDMDSNTFQWIDLGCFSHEQMQITLRLIFLCCM